MLYIRMGFNMLIQLYTSRVVLQVLGIDDYGIWNLVATLVVSISFISAPLASSTQRFLCTEIGKERYDKVNLIFSQSLILYLLFCIILLILFESIGLWFLNAKLTIPSYNLVNANIVFQLSIMSFIITLLRMPYDSMIIANEHMKFYAYISIVEGLLKLGIVYLLLLISGINHLVLYGILTLFVSLLTTIAYQIYCKQTYPSCRFRFSINKALLKEMASFSGWSLLGSFAVMTTNQGLNIILNIFFGVTINAAMGITNQVANAVNQFISNFQIAFHPQIVKTYASNQFEKLKNLIFRTGKFSFVLIFTIAFPLIYYIDPILKFWLGSDIPPYTSQLCVWMIASLLPEALSGPLWMTIQATGNIRNYQICISAIFVVNIVLSYILFKQGYSPIYCMYVRFSVSIICLLFRLFFIKKRINIPISAYCKKVIFPIGSLCFLSVGYFYLLNRLMNNDGSDLYLILKKIACFLLVYFGLIFYIILDKTERKRVLNKIKIFN